MDAVTNHLALRGAIGRVFAADIHESVAPGRQAPHGLVVTYKQERN